MILKKDSKNLDRHVATLYFMMILGVFPIYVPLISIQEITIKLMLYCIITITVSIVYIVLAVKEKLHYLEMRNDIDLYLVMAVLLSIVLIIIQVIQGRGDYEFYLLVCISIFSYFIISIHEEKLDKIFTLDYLDLFLIACAIIYIQLLFWTMDILNFQVMIGLLLKDRTARLSFLVLSVSVNALQYCCNRKAEKDKVYLALALMGFILLSLQNDIFCIVLISELFLVIPILFKPTVKLVKRNLILSFLFFFTLSSIPLINNYVKQFEMGKEYNPMFSIYLDLLIALVGIIVLFYWERIPKGFSQEVIVMKRLRRVYIFLLKLSGILFGAAICFGTLEDGRMGVNILIQIGETIKKEINQVEGTFGQILINYGVIGFIFFAVLNVNIISNLKKRYESSNRSAILTVIAVMFLVQSVFYKQQIVTTPIYIIFMTVALFQNKNEEGHNENIQKLTEEGIYITDSSSAAVGK